MLERRLHDRSRVRMPVRLRAKDVVRWGETVTKDLGGGGFRCIVYGAFWPMGTVVAFEMPLLFAEPVISGSARVAHVEQMPHSNTFDVGMTFLDVSQDTRSQIERFMAQQR